MFRQGNSSLAVDLDEIWGTAGPFAFSIWMQQESDPGDLFQYLVSTRSNDSGFAISQLSDVYQPNEVQMHPQDLPPPKLRASHAGHPMTDSRS